MPWIPPRPDPRGADRVRLSLNRRHHFDHIRSIAPSAAALFPRRRIDRRKAGVSAPDAQYDRTRPTARPRAGAHCL